MRDYQKECIQTIEDTFKKQSRQLIQLPTGAGKTWIFCQYLYKNSDRALIICPSLELKEQILQTAKRFNISSISSNLNDGKKNHVITTQYFRFPHNIDAVASQKYDHIVIDEAHHAHSPTYHNLLKSLEYDFKLLGCTATPERLDRLNLLDVFETISYQKNIFDLISQGHLANISAVRIKTGQNLTKKRGEFNAVELKHLDNDSRNKVIIKTFMENCRDKKTLIFCLNIDHAEKIAELLRLEGIKSAHIYGHMKKSSRRNILEQFRAGEITALTNCQLLTEGFDEPSIEALLIARPTASKVLYCQMIGRGLRKTETKDICYLYEVTDNNHKICTFNVACGKDPEFQREYKPGILLTDLHKEVEKLSLAEILIKKETMILFNNSKALKGNVIELLTSAYYNYKPTENQLQKLRQNNISYIRDINFLEASFLLWKHEKEKHYGLNTK